MFHHQNLQFSEKGTWKSKRWSQIPRKSQITQLSSCHVKYFHKHYVREEMKEKKNSSLVTITKINYTHHLNIDEQQIIGYRRIQTTLVWICKCPKPSPALHSRGTILCNMKTIGNISNVGRKRWRDNPKTWNFLSPHSTQEAPSLDSPIEAQVQLQALPFPSSSPRPHPEKGGKTTFIGLVSRGAGKLAGQCSGLHTFHQEASVGGGEGR